MKRMILFLISVIFASVAVSAETDFGDCQNIEYRGHFGIQARHVYELEETLILVLQNNYIELFNAADMDSIFFIKTLFESHSEVCLMQFISIIDSVMIVPAGDTVFVLNIADLNDVKRLATLPAINFADGVVSVGDYFYVSEDSNAMAIYDMSDLNNIHFVDTFFANDWSSELLVIDTVLYSNQGGALSVYSVADPANPSYFGFVAGGIGEYSPLEHCSAPLLYALRPSYTLSSIVALDISDPSNITEFASISLNGYLWELSVTGDTLLATGSTEDLQILSINDLSNPTVIPTFEHNYGINCFERDDKVYLYSIGLEYGFSIYSITDYQNAEKIYSSTSDYTAYNVTGRNDTIYFKDNLFGCLNIVDFTDKDCPKLVKAINDSAAMSGSYYDNRIAVINNNLFFTDNSGLVGLDLDDTLYNVIDTLRISNAIDFEPSGYSDDLLILSTNNGLSIIDAADVTDMDVLASISSAGLGEIAVKDTFIYAALQTESLRIFKSRSPLHVEFVKSFRDADLYADATLQTQDTFLYIGSYSNSSNGLAVYSIADPLNPSFLGSFYEDEGDYDFGTYISDMQIVNDTLACVMKPDFGAVVYNVKDPSAITKAGYFEMNSYFNWGRYGIFADKGYIYVTGNWEILYCLSDTFLLTGADAPRAECAGGLKAVIGENPFSSLLSVRYNMEKTERMTIDLFDVQGRFVKRICDRIQNPGEKETHADCSDIPKGVYFLKGSAGRDEFSLKVMKL